MRYRLTILSALLACTSSVLAADFTHVGAGQDSEYLPQFRFNVGEPGRRGAVLDELWQAQDILQPDFASSDPYRERTSYAMPLQQYDAKFFYPINNSSRLSLDLGLNIKYLDGVTTGMKEDGLSYTHNFNDAIPMIYATALFDLPFQGLSAGFEGSHLDYERTYAFDYKAKLKYQWNNSLGLEGGWQHQQYSLDNGQQDPVMEYESKGVFLDLFLNF